MRKINVLLAWGCSMLALGCSDPYARFKLGPAKPVVSKCVEAMGGLKTWRSMKPIAAVALVTMYDSDGKALVNEQQQVIDVFGNSIRAVVRLPGGTWSATVGGSGPATFEATGAGVSAEMSARLIHALRLTLHRARGAFNLLGQAERATAAEPARVAGADLVRVPVVGGRAGTRAYYFDPGSRMLKYLTAGADAPGGEGTVTIYTYQLIPSGAAFPEKISVVRIGDHVLIGDQPVLEVEYRQVGQ